MTTSWRDFHGNALPQLLQAATDCFVEHGYHGTTIRMIAARAGLSVPGYYHHYASKSATLIAIMDHAMTELHARSVAAEADAGGKALDRMRAHVSCLVLFHAHRGDLAFLASSEIRSLPPAARATHVAARDRQQRLLQTIIADGAEAGEFDTDDVRGVTRAVITMCTGVSQWYRPEGEFTPEQLADRYTALALRMVGSLEPTPMYSREGVHDG